MERRTCKRRLTSVLIVLLMLTALDMTWVSANPVSTLFFDDSKSGGSPAPNIANDDVYFSKEWVFADIEDTSARVTANYTFRNMGAVDAELPILLPFHERSWDIEIVQGKVPMELTSWGMPSLNRDFYYNDTALFFILYEARWIEFDVLIPAGASTTVTVRYSSKVAVEVHDRLHHSRMFSYLVGSARLWNHSMDHAFFEFRMHTTLFDERSDDGSLLDWERKEMNGYYIFTQEFYDWTPDADFVSLSWDTDLSSLSPSNSFFHIPSVWTVLILSWAFITMTISTIILLWPRRRRKAGSIKGRR